MIYAIIEISGKQFWVEPNKYYDFDLISDIYGDKIIFNRVLILNDSGNISIGKPYLKTVTIKGKILNYRKDKKKIIFKMNPKKKTRKKQGHRQQLTRVLIENFIVENKK